MPLGHHTPLAALPRGLRHPICCRGITGMMSLLFLMVFSALAVGFYASVNVAAQLSANERRAAEALTAADSGMALMRYELANLATEYVPESQLLVEVAYGLKKRMGNTPNLGNGLQWVGLNTAGDAILIPRSETAMIPLGNGTGFRCRITRSGRSLVVKIAGYSSGSTAAAGKGVEYTYEPKQIPAPLFDYGIASPGAITVENKVSILGNPDAALASVLSTSASNPAVTLEGSGAISGDVTLTEASANVSVDSGASIGGGTGPVAAAAHVKRITDAAKKPEFPVIDTSVYWPFVLKADGTPNYYNAATMGSTFTNVVLPPGDYSFNGSAVIKGVVYVQTPATIKFNGGTTLQGVVVFENNVKGTLAQNRLEFQGGVTFSGIDTLPATPQFPAELRALSGTMIAAKGASVEFGGGFGTVGASIFASEIAFQANAEGTIAGSIVSLDANPMVFGSRPITIRKATSQKWPAGTYFRSSYSPVGKSYREFALAGEGLTYVASPSSSGTR